MRGKVSVIIPTHKGQHSVPRAVNSVLKQSYQNFEIIVVDDNPPNSEGRRETEKAMSAFKGDSRVKYIKHKQNRGGSAARNTGISVVTGEYISFLDDDDVYLKDNLLKRVKALEDNPECGAVFCDVLHILGEWYGCIHKALPEELTVEGVLLNEAAVGSGSNLFAKTAVVKAINGFDTRFARHQDLEFCIRVLKETKPCILSEILVIKGYNGVNHEPNYAKMKAVEELYIDAFKEDIEGMSESDRKVFYYRRYIKLYGISVNEGNKQHINESVAKLQEYGFRYGLKQRIQVFCADTGLIKSPVIQLYKNIKSRKNNIDLLQISDEISVELKELVINYGK